MQFKITNLTDYIGITNTKTQETPVIVKPIIEMAKAEPKRVLLTWEASTKIQSKRMDEKLRKNLIVVGVIICLLLVVLQEYFLIFAVACLLFASSTLSKMAPQKIKYELTNHGVDYGGKLFEWSELKDFFFSTAFGPEVLVVNAHQALPGRLFFNFESENKQPLRQIFETYLHFVEQEPLTFIDKAYISTLSKLNIH